MSNLSNLYAEKVFAEHPAALWALDDQVDYISLISEANRDLSNWTISNGTAEAFSTIYDEPFNTSHVTKIIANVPSSDFGYVSCISPDLLNFSNLNKDLGTFSIGAYVNSLSAYISGIYIGYEYNDTSSGEIVQQVKYYQTSIPNNWLFVSETFDIPSDNTTFRAFLKIEYISGSTSTDDYHFLVNGISVGQWSEEFNSTSLGTTPISVPNTIYGDYSGMMCLEAKTYGLQENSGYYLIKDNKMLAKNTGIPMVYGAYNLTKIFPGESTPSLIIPGLGFLNESGQYNDYSLEMWMRINSDSVQKRKIVGPISSMDGLYVEGPFITLKINNHIGSYYVGEWTRPMLVHIKLKNTGASLMINGEQVISLSYSQSDLNLPSKLDSFGKDADWIGFYSYEDVSPIEIDCIAIYPYDVPSLVAKRRFVYGQGVEFPEGINQAYSGSSIYIDYPFADYTNNYSYPDIGKWQQGVIDNLSINNNILSTPDYSLPDIVLSQYNTDLLYSDNNAIQQESDNLFTLKPNSSWDNVEGYLLFNNLNLLREKVRSFYGVFKAKQLYSTRQILFHIESENSTNYFSIVLENNQIKYNIKFNDVEQTVHTSYDVQAGEVFSIALDIDTFSNHFGGSVAAFLGNLNSLKMYVAGNKELQNTFKGNIYTIGFSNEQNHKKIDDLFNEIGTSRDFENIFDTYMSGVDYDGGDSYFGTEGYEYDSSGELIMNDPTVPSGFYRFWDYYMDGGNVSSYSIFKLTQHIGSYSLVPSIEFDTYSLDINVSSYWEDYIPLTYFAQYVTDARGDQYYDLDFIQFNINYPSPSIFLEEEQNGSWTYEELQAEYANPVQRTYTSLDNQLFTGYLDYNDLKNKAVKNYKYDTSNSLVRSYVTFQYIETGANAVDGYFTNRELPPKEGVIEPGTNWMNTKYEIVNNMILYPPSTADYSNLALVTHLEFNVRGILKNKINIKSLEYASQAFNDSSPNPIGTRFGTSIYPYKKVGDYFDYKGLNPFTIYKGSSPYLYLTRYSGIELKGVYDPLITRGLSIPVNENMSNDYKILAMQTAIRFDQDFFPYAPTEIFEVKSSDSHIKFFMVANHPTGKRAKIYAINAITGQLEDGIAFYWNGKLVKEPTLTIKEWGFLGISFPSLLDFSLTVGSININGPITFNTISYYKSTNLQEVQQVVTRPWFSVKRIPPLNLEWDYWTSTKQKPILWRGVLVRSSTSYYGVDPSTIYKSYTGTNKIIVDSDQVLRLQDYTYSVYKDIFWNQDTINAV